ncbi:MAG: ATP synthase F0 subunit B [Actinobacteria bacterium]|nr:MAG: ATP synthase F0 subunit B [Actinomycetota bacterium]
MTEAIGELAAEVIHEIAVDPGPVIFGAEVLQFMILLAGLWLLSKRLLVPMLEKRREGVLADLREAAGADARMLESEQESRRILAEARKQAAERIEQARRRGAQLREEAGRGADEEANRVLDQARQTLEQEEADAINTVHAQLVDLVTISTRRVLEEALSEEERRELVEKSVLSSLDELENVALAE